MGRLSKQVPSAILSERDAAALLGLSTSAFLSRGFRPAAYVNGKAHYRADSLPVGDMETETGETTPTDASHH